MELIEDSEARAIRRARQVFFFSDLSSLVARFSSGLEPRARLVRPWRGGSSRSALRDDPSRPYKSPSIKVTALCRDALFIRVSHWQIYGDGMRRLLVSDSSYNVLAALSYPSDRREVSREETIPRGIGAAWRQPELVKVWACLPRGWTSDRAYPVFKESLEKVLKLCTRPAVIEKPYTFLKFLFVDFHVRNWDRLFLKQ